MEGRVRILVGRGLFDFGDRDGSPEEALLRHPLDVAADSNVFYLADTYNNKIKSIAFGSLETRTVFGNGNPAILHEPGGIAAWEGQLLVADTNNPRLLRGTPAAGELEKMPLRW